MRFKDFLSEGSSQSDKRLPNVGKVLKYTVYTADDPETKLSDIKFNTEPYASKVIDCRKDDNPHGFRGSFMVKGQSVTRVQSDKYRDLNELIPLKVRYIINIGRDISLFSTHSKKSIIVALGAEDNLIYIIGPRGAVKKEKPGNAVIDPADWWVEE